MPSVLIPLADGVEEIEAVIMIDLLRRAGWEVVAAGTGNGTVTASRGVKLLPDADWSAVDVDRFDVLALPGGGPGTERLRAHTGVLRAVRRLHGQGKLIAAICAGPLVLQEAGILGGVRATCHPSAAAALTAADYRDERVVIDGKIVTSQGPGTAFEFALAILEQVEGPDAVQRVAPGLMLK